MGQAAASCSSSTRRHLLFDDASKAFVESVYTDGAVDPLKGVGVFFVTQTPKDIPADVLGQLGNRVQHALRAFTPDDAKALRATVRTFPKSDFYDLEELLTQIGEPARPRSRSCPSRAFAAPVVHTRMRPPHARMGACGRRRGAPPRALRCSRGTEHGLDSQSAREMLAARLEQAAPQPPRRATFTRAPEEGGGKATGGGANAIRETSSSPRPEGRSSASSCVGLFGLLKKRV